MTCARLVVCECGGRLVHLNRGPDESTTSIGQYVHNVLPRDFNFVDTDAIVHARASRLLRYIEHKPIGGELSRSQREILPIMAAALDAAGHNAYLMHADPPYHRATVARVWPDPTRLRLSRPRVLVGEDLDLFLRARPMPPIRESVTA